jgi:precorrin-6Y C5,15-methyltransferase (decarboxylating)
MTSSPPMKPEEIYAESFRLIEAEVGKHDFDARQWPVVRRMIHASGDVELVHDVRFHGDAARAGVAALKQGLPLVTDVTMVAAGLNRELLDRLGVHVACSIRDADVHATAVATNQTRSFCAMEKGIAEFGDAIYVVGNAPTALLALCAAVREGRVRPALVVALPVGFVSVQESKEQALALDVPVITVLGRKGGSALAAAAVNALGLLAEEESGAAQATPLPSGEGGRRPGEGICAAADEDPHLSAAPTSSPDNRKTATILVIGMGHDGPVGLAPELRRHIAAADVLAGGKRLLELCGEFRGETIPITADIPGLIEQLKEAKSRGKTIVVVATGDPLFYGVGANLLAAFERDELTFLPHVSSLQLAFARLKTSWHDARCVTLHGRPLESIRPAIVEGCAKIAILTDNKNQPAVIGDYVSSLGVGSEYDFWVCEELGGANERVTCWTAASIRGQTFSPLNVVVLLRKSEQSEKANGSHDLPLVGIPEELLAHGGGRRGMITKREVRLVSLAYLALRPGEVLWDVGAGSGSVSIEAARLSASLRVHAIERSVEALEHLRTNVRACRTPGVTVVEGSAPEAFAGLPDPDAVFVGGSGGQLETVLAEAVRRLRPGGRLVMNCIALENFSQAWRVLSELGLQPQATSVQLAHSQPVGNLHRLEPDSPIFILRGTKS